MDCTGFENLLGSLLEGKLRGAERRQAETHLAGCPRCQGLHALLGDEKPILDAPADLTRSILERTSGRPCRSAAEQSCDFVDGKLEETDRQLLELHLAACAECGALVGALRHLAVDLPPLAHLQPDPRFVGDVVAATVARPAARPRTRGLETWSRLLVRPRLSWEVAYVGAMLLWVVFGVSGSTLRAVPARTLQLLGSNPVEVVAEASVPIARSVADLGQQAWETTGAKGIGSARQLGTVVSERYRRAEVATRPLRRHGTELGEAMAELSLDGGAEALKNLGGELKSLLKQVTSDPDAESEQKTSNPEGRRS